MSPPTLIDNLDSIEVFVDEEGGWVTGGHFIIRVGRLAVAQEEVPIARMTHCRACLVVLRAALRFIGESTSAPVAVVVPDRTAIWLLGPDGPNPTPPLVDLVKEVRGQLEEQLSEGRLYLSLPEPGRRPGSNTGLAIAPSLLFDNGVRQGRYLSISGGIMERKSIRVSPALSDEEALLAIIKRATTDIDHGDEVEVWSMDHALFLLLNPGLASTTVRAARYIRELESTYRLTHVLRRESDMIAAYPPRGM